MRRGRHILRFIVFLLPAVAIAAPADPLPFWPAPPEVHAPSDVPVPETTRLVHDLTAGDYATRERASEELAEKGLAGFPGLRSLVIASGSPELAARVSPLLKREPFVLPAGMPTRAVNIMQAYGRVRRNDDVASDRLAKLLNFRPDDESAELAYRFLEAQENLPAGRAALALKADDRAYLQARFAIVDGDVDRAEKLLVSLLGSSDGSAVASACITLLALRDGPRFDAAAFLASLDGAPIDALLRNDIAFLAWRAAGKPAAAASFAKEFPDRDFTMAALLEARDYQALSELPQIVIRSSGRPPDRRLQVLALRFGSHPERAGEFLKRIRAPGSISTFDCSAPVTLLQNDDVEGALAILREEHRNTEAALILIRQLRLREAFQLDVEYSPEILRLLVAMGLTRQAEEFRRAHQHAAAFNVRAAAETDLEYARVLRGAGFSGRADELDRAVWPLLSSPPQPGWFDTPEQFNEARFWLDTLTEPAADPDRIALVRKILAGREHPAISPAIVPELLRTVYDYHSLAIAFNALARAGNLEVAQKLLDAWCARENDPAAYELLADWQLAQGHPDLAATAYLHAAPLQRTNASLMYRTGIALSRQPATKQAGQRLIETSRLLVLSQKADPSGYADAIRRCEGDVPAEDWYDGYTARFGHPEMPALARRLPRARAAAEVRNDLHEALALQIQCLFAPVDGATPRWPTLMEDLARHHRLAALDALARRDFATLAAHLEKSLGDGPPDVDLFERTFPTFRTADPTAAARLLKEAIARLEPVVDKERTAEPWASQRTRLLKMASAP